MAPEVAPSWECSRRRLSIDPMGWALPAPSGDVLSPGEEAGSGRYRNRGVNRGVPRAFPGSATGFFGRRMGCLTEQLNPAIHRCFVALLECPAVFDAGFQRPTA